MYLKTGSQFLMNFANNGHCLPAAADNTSSEQTAKIEFSIVLLLQYRPSVFGCGGSSAGHVIFSQILSETTSHSSTGTEVRHRRSTGVRADTVLGLHLVWPQRQQRRFRTERQRMGSCNEAGDATNGELQRRFRTREMQRMGSCNEAGDRKQGLSETCPSRRSRIVWKNRNTWCQSRLLGVCQSRLLPVLSERCWCVPSHPHRSDSTRFRVRSQNELGAVKEP